MQRHWTLVRAFGLILVFVAVGAIVSAQNMQKPAIRVLDSQRAPIAGARILDTSGSVLAVTDSSGEFFLSASISEIQITAPGFVTVSVTIADHPQQSIILKPAAQIESVSVTAYQSPLAALDSPASTRNLDSAALRQSASPALDNKLRLVPGAELFRRSSSLVANPTSQGISLRGLGSTAASRTLVLSDDIPLLDPYGGWIHWEELPELSIKSVEVVRGGASDLYGSSAIGGVINFLPVRAASNRFEYLSSYGSLNTTDNTLLGTLKYGKWTGLGSGGLLRTDGYILTTPDERGTVDVPSNVHAQNGLVEVDRDFLSTGRIFSRGSGFNEARSNGTPIQTNATRLWRYSSGADWTAASGGTLIFRVFGDNEHYRQGFSTIAANRNSETLLRIGITPAQELGAAAHWSQPLGATIVVLAGADTHDVRATDFETSYKLNTPSGILDTSARQRQTGVYAEGLWTPAKWTFSLGGRVDHFSNFDALQWTSPPLSLTHLPDFSETVFDPRLGVARRLTNYLSLTASTFRAYRAPTQNELYRTGQVGQELTKANPNLRSERATGWEAGFVLATRYNTTVRTSYFWTQVNRPITALTVSTTPTQITEVRENLGQIESRGVAFDAETVPVRWLSLIGGYQYADATVTKFASQPVLVACGKPETTLVGCRIPQVARNMGTLQARFTYPKIGILSLQGRMSGSQYDNDLNTYLLHSYFKLDAYASHDFGNRFEVFASGENLFDRTIEVGRTPTLTLGTPLVGRIGIRVRVGE
ncbi:Colicin I receptor precursor [Acidisarcina polymorpha]|uniref:Colicin I receptor n=1 Tax=Acidisarcina polymorpha TaxID=2211140 RepID=A0A2Z5FYM7_9BACT|nr:TonB-dependent receptor [Acidisarcina polymorpha]AXC11624.1 Colicin I receptor precursor [Acidisarcina polymorpha]